MTEMQPEAAKVVANTLAFVVTEELKSPVGTVRVQLVLTTAVSNNHSLFRMTKKPFEQSRNSLSHAIPILKFSKIWLWNTVDPVLLDQ